MRSLVDRNDLPKKLRQLNNWGLWRFVTDGGQRPRKVPLQLSGKYASPTEPEHFSRLRDVITSPLIRKKHVEGLAFALFADDDITVFDFDHVDQMSNAQRKRIRRMCRLTYSERSQSGNGVHCFFSGHDSRILRKKFNWNGMQVEVYRADRFIAVTGDHIEESPDDLCDYDEGQAEWALGELPYDATLSSSGVTDDAANELMDQEPTLSVAEILERIERDAQHDTRDAGPVWEWLCDGYESGDDRSSNDLIVCKVLWKYGAVYSQIEEVVLSYPLRDDDKWSRSDYRRSTILKAYDSATLSSFEDEGPGGDDDDTPKSGRKKAPSYMRRIVAVRRQLIETAARYNDIITRIGSGRVEDASLERMMARADSLRSTCYDLMNECNALDVQRLNQWYGEVIIGSELRIGAYYNGKKRLMRWDTFEKAMRSQREAVSIKERAPRGRAETGIMKVEQVLSADHWLAHPDHLRFPYEPELLPSPRLLYTDTGFREGDADKPYNLFEGCLYAMDARPPHEDEVMPIIRHIHNVWASKHIEVTQYILNWMARMVQYPHKVGQTAIVLRSIEGVGKNIISNIFSRYYGIHAVDITDMDSVRGFNAMPMRSVMVVFNEATYGGNKKTAGALKAMVTDEHLTSQEKYQPSITHRNCSHILIFSNNDWIVPVGLDDRRFLILECDMTHMEGGRGEKYFERLITQCINKGGDRAFIQFLLHRDISKFNPRSIPRQHANHAHVEQTMRGLSTYNKWILDCAERRGFPLTSGIIIRWHRTQPQPISVIDLRDSLNAYAQGRRFSDAGDETMYGTARRLTSLLGSEVEDIARCKHVSSPGRGRGIMLPCLDDVFRTCRMLQHGGGERPDGVELDASNVSDVL